MNKVAWVIVLIVVLAGGWYLLGNNSTSSSLPTQIDGWETYTNEQWKFAMQYPGTMTVRQMDNHSVQFFVLGPTQSTGTEMYDGISMEVMYETYEESFKDVADAAVQNSESNSEITEPLKPAKLGGVNGYTYSVTGLGSFVNYYLPINEGEYLVVTYLVSDPTNAGFKDTVDKMLRSMIIG